MTTLSGWENLYVIVGSSAGAVIGFVIPMKLFLWLFKIE
jgi:hypothetical protein